ncbi:MFS transporter [Helicobacter valdiviensis]|nr:MFS transporter [Helicobacter valdiviensis]
MEITKTKTFQFALFASTSMTVLGSIVIAPAIPALEMHFLPQSIPNIDLLSRLILTLPALFVMLFSPLSGFLLDKFGRIKFLIPAMYAWSIFGALGALWDNIYWILFTRAMFGIATAFVMTAASALVADYYAGEDRQRALSLQGFATACGSATFMVIGGFLAHFGWRYPFVVYALGVLIALLAAKLLFEPIRAQNSLEDYEDGEFKILPLVPIYFLGFFVMVTYYISPTQIPSFMIYNLEIKEVYVGVGMSASAIFYGLASLSYQRLRKFFSIALIYGVGFLLMGVGFLLIFYFHSFYMVLLALVLFGIGGGPIIVNNISTLIANTNPKHRAKTLGILSAVIYFGQFVSPLLSQPFVREFDITYLFMAAGLFLLCLSPISYYIGSHYH